MNRKKNKGLNSMPVAARRKKSSAKTANAAKTNALPKPVSPFIVLRCLADIYGVDKNTLSFAVAEIPDGEDGFDLLPVVLIVLVVAGFVALALPVLVIVGIVALGMGVFSRR